MLFWLLPVALVQDSAAAKDSVRPSRFTALPVVSYSDVTGLQYGAAIFHRFRVGADPLTRGSWVSAYFARTAREHTKAYVQLDRWSPRNETRSRVRVEYLSYPLPYFGLGANTPDSAEEWYSSGVGTVQVFTERVLGNGYYVHAGARYLRSRMRVSEPGRELADGAVPGSSGSDMLTSTLGLVLDSRDNAGAPRTGTYARFMPSIASRSIGSDFAFRRLTIDARRYRTFGTEHVVAAQLQYDGVSGTTPFDQLPMIGADTAMRGYARGRFRDRHAFAAQAEARSAFRRRVGVVVFAGAGAVAPSLSQLTSGSWYPTTGAGLRYLLSPRDRTVARLDLGVGRGSFGITVGIGEAF